MTPLPTTDVSPREPREPHEPHEPHDGAAFEAWLAGLPQGGRGVDFYQALRRIESAHAGLPRLGEALRPVDEPVRLKQPADLSFAPTPVAAIGRPEGGGPVQVLQRIFGLVGPHGPLPIHLTELARDRSQHHGDHALLAFLDTLTHRFALLFYRAWAQAQPVLSLDRPGDLGLQQRLGALFGRGEGSLLSRDAAGDDAAMHFAGRLSRQVRDADGLQAWCRAQLNLPIRIAQWSGHWMSLDRAERTRLSRRLGHPLGGGAVLGGQTWDVQHKFRIVVGPLRFDQFQALLPDSPGLARLRSLVRQWVGLEFEWDVQLCLRREDVPSLHLGSQAAAGAPRLGRSTWLGHYRRPGDADDMVMNPERMPRMNRRRARNGLGAHPN